MYRFTLLVAAAVLLVACGDGVTAPSSPVTTPPVTTIATSPVVTSPVITSPVSTSPVSTSPVITSLVITSPVMTSPVTTSPVMTSPVTTSPVITSPVVEPVIAVWPAAGVVFDSPEAVAEDFISAVFGIEPAIGPFQQGDARSGEIDVLTQLDDDDPSTTRPAGVTLLLRMLGPDDGWFVIGAVSEGVTIDTPETGSTVPVGDLAVEGLGRGFESTVVVSAFVAGEADPLAVEIVMTDWAVPTPYATSLDLSAAEPGDVVAIIARGDVGIEATGEFAALPIIVG
jgi:hypothetical protein